MKKLAISAFMFVVVLLSADVFAASHSGKNQYLLGNSAAALGRGGTGVSAFGTDTFYLNPASVASHERMGFGLQFGTLQGGLINPDLTFALPTSYGVIGADLRVLNISGSDDFRTAVSVSLGGGKDLTSKVMVGVALNIVYASQGGSLFYVGPTIGAIYKFDGMRKRRGFGIFSPNAGFALNLGLPLGDNRSSVNFNSFTIGYDFLFYRHNNFDVKFYNDISGVNGIRRFPIKLGLESLILSHYIIRLGGIIPVRDDYSYGTVSGGLGYRFSLGNFAGSANYALNWSEDRDFTHYIGLELEYGRLDREAPATRINPDKKYFSPNHDGKKDYVLFTLGVKDTSRIKAWKLLIRKPDGKVVKEFRISERDTIEGLTFGGFFKRLIQKKESLVVPEKIMWDGTDSEGKILPDAKYSYSFTATDERGNMAAVKKGTVLLDRTAPDAVLTTKEDLFSPNGDKQKDDYIIVQKITTSPEDEWKAGFRNSENMVVKTYSWTGNDVPSRVVWKGKDDKNKDVPEGLYYYFIESADKSGNRGGAGIDEISLTRKFETADITLGSDYFSFKRDRELNFFPRLSDDKGLENWKIVITDKSGSAVHEITGMKKLPKLVKWDCRNSEGKEPDDGEYLIRLTTEFISGNTPASFDKRLIIDSTPPEVAISHSPDLFSPDNDGENDVLTIEPEAEDRFGLRSWMITVYSPSGIVFKTFEGKKDVPEEIKWDGLGADREIVESAADYFVELTAVDAAGNRGVSEKKKLQVDILVIVTERGLKMRISNIEFEFAKASLKRRGRRILDRVYTILEKYGKYDVVIEGHTDNVGSDEKNLDLSEKRAESVKKYLIKKGITGERLETIGMGESVPLKDNKTAENRRRNRRVEFLLVKRNE